MQSTDLRGDRDLDRDEETERDRFLNSATSVSENLLVVMVFPGSCVATYMGEFTLHAITASKLLAGITSGAAAQVIT